MNMLAMPWIATGIFVYQSFITESKGWGTYVIAQSFMVYSVLSVITLLVAGFLIDKFTSRKLLIFMNIPLLIYVDKQRGISQVISPYIFLRVHSRAKITEKFLGASPPNLPKTAEKKLTSNFDSAWLLYIKFDYSIIEILKE